MRIYELFSIYIIGAAFGVIFRYIVGWRKRHVAYAAVNVLLGGVECAISYFFLGGEYFQLFISGVGGIVLDFAYCVCRLILGN